MVDSVKLVNEDVLKRIHASYAGKIHKGHGVVAATTSIPTKYQTIVTDNGDKKGFLSTSKRFDHQALNENPGPGSYVKHKQFEQSSTSHSKKGYGGFVSKARRVSRPLITSGPGPGKYSYPSLLQSKEDFNKATTTSVFHQPIAQVLEKIAVIPAPNCYDPKSLPKGKVNNVSAGAAFKSKTKRESVLLDKRGNPAPGQYDVKDTELLPESRAPISSFKSPGDRNFIAKNENPGPGQYKPHEPTDPANKLLFPKKHYLCLSAPAMPLPPQPVAPGPGAYELRDYEGPVKHYMSSSAFVSSSSRWHNLGYEQALPGPGAYHPIKAGKESFIYNHGRKWI